MDDVPFFFIYFCQNIILMAGDKSNVGLLIGIVVLLLAGSIFAAVNDEPGIMTGPGIFFLLLLTGHSVYNLWNKNRGKAFLVIFLFLVFTACCLVATYAYDDVLRIVFIVISDMICIAEIAYLLASD